MSGIIMGRRRRLLCASAAIAAALPVPALAQTQTFQFNIEAQSLDGALRAFARTTRRPVLFDGKLVKGKTSPGLKGTYTAESGLAVLLSASRLRATLGSRGAYVIKAHQLAANGEGAALQAMSAGGADEQAAADAAADPIVITGSRIDKAGYEAPTPTTVVGQAELKSGDRPNIVEVLNDLPQFKASTTATATAVSIYSGMATPDMRGLGVNRTLSLINGRRFVTTILAGGDLNFIPKSLVKRVDVVTGGASAAWGSGAVAGVVNIILDDKMTGLSAAAESGVSSRGDGARYRGELSWGTKFADDRGHFMIAAEYLHQSGALGRTANNRPNLDGALYTSTSGQLSMERDVNFTNATPGGIIMSGPLAGQNFNTDGTLSPLVLGSAVNPSSYLMIGGGSRSSNDHYSLINPYDRYNVFARASYELSDAAKLWVDFGWMRTSGSSTILPQVFRATSTGGGLVIQRDNAFLSPAIRSAMGATTSFRLGRFLDDIGPNKFFSLAYQRDQVDGAIGIEGKIGDNWRYSAYYNHGEYRTKQRTFNQTITTNFNNAVDAIISPTTGQPICRIALTDANTACRPINLLGQNNASPEAIAYAFGGSLSINRILLDSTGINLRGDLFSTWAGPVSIATGVEARWESIVTDYVDPLSLARAFGFDNRSNLSGGFNVKEGFVEIAVPLLDAEGIATIDVNGAARYSDYSNSGGIWSWKFGGTARLFDDFRLRAVYSRDIRSPNISELYTEMALGVGTVADPFNGNNPVSYQRYTGGNPDLQPEIGHTLTLGGSWTPAAVPGLNLSVDAYRIDIDGVIGTITIANALAQCFAGSAVACATIERRPDGSLLAYGNYQNLAFYKTRGVDFEIGYRLPVNIGEVPGTVRFRLLGTYVDKFIVNDGVITRERVGDIGSASWAVPWRMTAMLGWETEDFSTEARIRYVGRGYQDQTLPIVNNRIAARAYLDLSAQYRIGEAFSIYANINNALDRDPPLSGNSALFHDAMGRYFSGGVRLKF